MKKARDTKIYSVKLLRGSVGPDGKNAKAGTVVKCPRSLAKIYVATNRGEIVEGKTAESKSGGDK